MVHLKTLPESCYDSALKMEEQKEFYTLNAVFPEELIDQLIDDLKDFNDRRLRKRAEDNIEELTKLVEQFFHCG